LLSDEDGQIQLTHSISAGLDYAAVGPEHSYLHDIGRVRYDFASDDEVLEAFQLVAKTEGILPALESTHALAYVVKHAHEMPENQIVVVNLSGRGDKDVDQLTRRLPRLT
jgi:tryptophan synthase beta chain